MTRSSKSKAPRKAWAGRFTKGPDPRAEAFSASCAVDLRLLPYDVMGSKAHARMLAAQGIITAKEGRTLEKGLDQIYQAWLQGKVMQKVQDEDVHMLVERLLYDLVGPVAGKLHTGRSRNDQVITDFKLYLRVEVAVVRRALQQVQKSLLQLAQSHADCIMPGYTHLQIAQPVLVSHWLLAHLEAFYRDEKRFESLLEGGLDESPLGAAALAGTSHPIDRAMTAALLGFGSVTANSMDTVADRDYALEFLSAASICGVHLSRLAEELVLYSSSEFKFLSMDQGFSTGSSIMPQKRNPDIAELIRGRVGRLNGNLLALLTVMKGLPLTYNRDLQEDKEPVFASADNLVECLTVLAPMLEGLTFHPQRMEQACQQGFPTATEAADHLVRQGLPFREAHEVIGRIVTHCSREQRALEGLSYEEWKAFHALFKPSIVQDVTLHTSVAAKTSAGGTAPAEVNRAIKKHARRLNKLEIKD